MEDKKIFDEYQVECNECQRYWNDQCDGVREGTTKPCTSFLATRRTNIPEQIKNLEKRLVRAENSIGILAIGLVIAGVGIILGVCL